MSDWRSRAEVLDDVVYFNYTKAAEQRRARNVFVWDVDKTYLDTKFESIGGLWRAVAEKAFQKRNIPGTAELVRALRDSHRERGDDVWSIFFFITATPPQLEHRIREKLHLDGIFPAGIYFKDNLRNLHPGRWGRLTKQVGFKLQALLQMRVRLGEDVREILWGDDSEQDAVIYSLYSDICARRLPSDELDRVLHFFHVPEPQIDQILALQSQVDPRDPVDRIYINLAADTDAEYYAKFGARVVPTYNTFQTALDLFQLQHLTVDQTLNVAVDLKENFQFSAAELERSFDDLIRRQVLTKETVLQLSQPLRERGLFGRDYEPSVDPLPRTQLEVESRLEPLVPAHIDYIHDYR